MCSDRVAIEGRRACGKQFRVIAEDLAMMVTASSTKLGETPPDTTLLPIIQISTEAALPFILDNVFVP